MQYVLGYRVHQPKKSSSKKAKKTGGKKVSSMLKKLIEELLTDGPIPTAELNLENLEEASENGAVPEGPASIFLQLSNRIDNAESKNEDASRGLIYSYFDFGKAVFKRYKELKPGNGKDGSHTLVKSEVRESIPEAKCSDEALRKRMEILKDFQFPNNICIRFYSFKKSSFITLEKKNIMK
jgi:hypothetical protein